MSGLKVLFSEMDLAEIRLIRKVIIKQRGAAVFRKFRPPPILWEPLSMRALPCFSIYNCTTI
jgi:hypothetical protein